MDFSYLASNLGIGIEDFMELVELFLSTSQAELEKIEQGLEAGDIEQVRAASHSIKGASANLGFMDMAEISGEIESFVQEGSVSSLKTKILAMKDCLEKIFQATKMG